MNILDRFRVDLGFGQDIANEEGATEEEAARQRGPTPERAPSESLSDAPTPQQRRRARSDSTGGDMDQEREVKRRKRFAAQVCENLGLPSDALEEYAELSLVDMLITMQATVMLAAQGKQKSEAELLIHSPEFKDKMREKLRACLLSPNLTAYVDELPENIIAFVKKNLATFNIPQEAIENPTLITVIETLISSLLTHLRSGMKGKLLASVENAQHISCLAKALAPPGHHDVTIEHWARFAFLCHAFVTFTSIVEECAVAVATARKAKKNKSKRTESESQLVDGPGAEDTTNADANSSGRMSQVQGTEKTSAKMWSAPEFWSFVDNLLEYIHADAAEKNITKEARKKCLERFFTDCLQKDMKSYPGPNSKPSLKNVMIAWQKAIHTDLIW